MDKEETKKRRERKKFVTNAFPKHKFSLKFNIPSSSSTSFFFFFYIIEQSF
jgi:hypothetical protein